MPPALPAAIDPLDQKYFHTLDEDHPLFAALRDDPPRWWDFLKRHTGRETPADRRLYINIRKFNTIDVYHQGGLLVEISHDGDRYGFRTHYKYAADGRKNDRTKIQYVGVDIAGMATESGLDAFLRRIHECYSQKTAAGVSEKFLQSEIYCEGDYIDTEFAYNGFQFPHRRWNARLKAFEEVATKDIRIDLLRHDADSRRLTFVELKREEDNRLLCKETDGVRPEPEILTQMEAYNAFVRAKGPGILAYYRRLVGIGQGIGIIRHDIDASRLELNDRVELLIQRPLAMSARRARRDKAIADTLTGAGITFTLRP